MSEKTYIAIDLKSFYASVECVYRGLDPLTTNLVVADESRTEKTICLAVSPSLKSFGVSSRPRLFEVIQSVAQANTIRRQHAPGRNFTGKSTDYNALMKHPALELDYIIAPPRMAAYLETSTAIYQIYLKYFAPEDIHVYSVDEVFIDATHYLKLYGMSPEKLAQKILLEILDQEGITATVGIGTNLYLSKVAMDIVAKRMPADKNGVRIASLDEMEYRKQLWSHRPLTDFWRIGHGYARKLEKAGLYTMGDIARCSLGGPGCFHNEDLLYKLFGVNAELLIDHAWGWEPCTMQAIKSYRPRSNSLSTGQVLHCPYTAEKAGLIAREMVDLLVLDLVEKKLVTNQLVLTIGYDIENLSDPAKRAAYKGAVNTDYFGRKVPKHAHGTIHLEQYTASTQQIVAALDTLYNRIVDTSLLVRRLTISANNILPETSAPVCDVQQLDLFSQAEALPAQKETDRERRRQCAILHIQHKYGKNALLKGMNLEEGATARDRNKQIGGHKA